MKKKILPALVLVVAVAAVAATVAWAVTGTGDSGRPATGLEQGMMGYGVEGTGGPVRSLADAERQAQGFADRLDLRVGEVIQFANNFYAELLQDDGTGATEVLVDPANGAVWIEYGPAMMWNTRYGMAGGACAGMMDGASGGMMDGASGGMMDGGGWGGMMDGGSGGMMDDASGGSMMGGGMMGGALSETPAPDQASVTAEEAEQIAGTWLGAQGEGFRAAKAEGFPGYYTMEVLRDGKVSGMLSVNAFTGAVWYHSWHGRFVAAA